jgi:hypothetical protein
VQAATAFQHDNGNVYYLIMTESLWFGDDMEHSLSNGLIAKDTGVDLCTNPYDQSQHLGITHNDEEILPFQQIRNTVGCQTFKPSRNDVLCAMSQHHPNVIYLNPEGQPHPGESLTIQSARPLLTDYPIDTDGLYFGAVAPSDDAALMWPHQIYQILTSQCHVAKDPDRSNASVHPDDPIVDASYPGICTILTTARHHGKALPELLQRQWGIGYKVTQKTIEVTTQLILRHATHPLRRRYQTNLLSLNHKRINKEFHSDTLFSKYESYSKNTCAQVFTTQSGFVVVDPMTSKSRYAEALTTLVPDVGILNLLFCDNAPEMVGPKTDFRKATNYYKIKLSTNEPHPPKQNRIAEGTIGHMRHHWLTIQQKQVSPWLWDFGLVWIADIMSRTHRFHNRRTGLEVVTGDTCDI